MSVRGGAAGLVVLLLCVSFCAFVALPGGLLCKRGAVAVAVAVVAAVVVAVVVCKRACALVALPGGLLCKRGAVDVAVAVSSEEHTSELQSRRMHTYCVLCLKKK